MLPEKEYKRKGRHRASGVDRFLKKEEVVKFFASFKPNEERHKLAFAFMGFLGLRCCEAVSINKTDFTPDYKRVSVRLAKTGRIKKTRLPEALRGLTQIHIVK